MTLQLRMEVLKMEWVGGLKIKADNIAILANSTFAA